MTRIIYKYNKTKKQKGGTRPPKHGGPEPTMKQPKTSWFTSKKTVAKQKMNAEVYGNTRGLRKLNKRQEKFRAAEASLATARKEKNALNQYRKTTGTKSSGISNWYKNRKISSLDSKFESEKAKIGQILSTHQLTPLNMPKNSTSQEDFTKKFEELQRIKKAKENAYTQQKSNEYTRSLTLQGLKDRQSKQQQLQQATDELAEIYKILPQYRKGVGIQTKLENIQKTIQRLSTNLTSIPTKPETFEQLKKQSDTGRVVSAYETMKAKWTASSNRNKALSISPKEAQNIQKKLSKNASLVRAQVQSPEGNKALIKPIGTSLEDPEKDKQRQLNAARQKAYSVEHIQEAARVKALYDMKMQQLAPIMRKNIEHLFEGDLWSYDHLKGIVDNRDYIDKKTRDIIKQHLKNKLLEKQMELSIKPQL